MLISDWSSACALPIYQSIETISLEEALELFRLPRTVGLFEEKEMQVNIGRFGPYVLHDKKFYSIPKGLEPLDISSEKAVEIRSEGRRVGKERVRTGRSRGAPDQ